MRVFYNLPAVNSQKSAFFDKSPLFAKVQTTFPNFLDFCEDIPLLVPAQVRSPSEIVDLRSVIPLVYQ